MEDKFCKGSESQLALGMGKETDSVGRLDTEPCGSTLETEGFGKNMFIL